MLRKVLILLILPILTQTKPLNTCSYVQGILVCDDDYDIDDIVDYDYPEEIFEEPAAGKTTVVHKPATITERCTTNIDGIRTCVPVKEPLTITERCTTNVDGIKTCQVTRWDPSRSRQLASILGK